MRSRRVKIRVKIIVLETVPFQIEMRRAQGQNSGQNYRPGDRRQMAEMCFQKAPGQDLLKTAVSQRAQKRNSIAGRGAAKWQKFASKRLPARIWPKTAVSQAPEEKFNSRPRGRQMAEICFQKAPGQDLAKSGQWHWRPSCFKLK